MNCLSVSLHHSIVTLAQQGWSARRIARELDINRETVGRHLRANQAISTPGPEAESSISKPAIPTPGFPEGEAVSKPAIVTTGSAGRVSDCRGYEEQIKTALARGLSLKRIHQDLVGDEGFKGSYQSIKRFARKIGASIDPPFRRIESPPGEEMQVDFGQGAWVLDGDKRRRPHVFRAVLSHSRKGYTEAVWRQDTETFIRCLENGFRHFGGVPLRLVVDNLKAAVLKADWFDPDLNPKLVDFCRHYGTLLSPTKPAMPRHKGKVEAGVNYVQENALKGRTFASLAEQNQFLIHWESSVADTRIHGTVKQQVAKLFASERPALRPLPQDLFPAFTEAKRTVHRDGYVEFDKAYYSAPPEFVGRQLWVRAESRLVRLYNFKMEQVGVHARAEPGRFTTDPEHIHPHKIAAIERGAEYLLARCRSLGPSCAAWSAALLEHRGPEALRSLQGLLHLAREYPVPELEQAAASALQSGQFRLRQLRTILSQPGNCVQLGFLQAHPLIRSMDTYKVAFPS